MNNNYRHKSNVIGRKRDRISKAKKIGYACLGILIFYLFDDLMFVHNPLWLTAIIIVAIGVFAGTAMHTSIKPGEFAYKINDYGGFWRALIGKKKKRKKRRR